MQPRGGHQNFQKSLKLREPPVKHPPLTLEMMQHPPNLGNAAHGSFLRLFPSETWPLRHV